MFLVAGWLLACYVSGPAVLLLGRGLLGGWAYSVSPAWGGVRVLCLPRAFSYVRSRDSHGRRLGFSRLADRVGDCSIVSARLVT